MTDKLQNIIDENTEYDILHTSSHDAKNYTKALKHFINLYPSIVKNNMKFIGNVKMIFDIKSKDHDRYDSGIDTVLKMPEF